MQTQEKAAVAAPEITRALAGHLAALRFDDMPDAAIHAARRGVLDWLGCALAGSSHPTLDIVLGVMTDLNPAAGEATVLGRKCRAAMLDAALINGQMGHVLDYDDTHMGGVVLHTSSPALAALFALSESAETDGEAFLLAYAAGFEAGVRIGRASPGHHRGGWHLTGTLGTFAASAAAAKLLALDAAQITHALGVGGTQAAGMQQNRGTMCKSFHAGKAAANGILAATLAHRGFTSTAEIIEGRQGFCRIYSDVATPDAVLDGLGRHWEITRNGHKPYACGVVLHPAIEALIGIRSADGIDPATVEAVALRVHPLVLSITGVTDPQTGLQSKFSIYHSAAVALRDGAAGTRQYTDERARDPGIIALRRRITVQADATLRNDEAHACVTVAGKTYERHVGHAGGTADNPMTDDAIQSKFIANAEPVIGEARAQRVCELAWSLEKQPGVKELLFLCA
jgi:2-methylcitrate dehydratase PrpD